MSIGIGKEPESGKKSIILAVDDNPNNLAVISDCLKDTGFRVLVAQDGESALQKVEMVKPDLILMDVRMPGIDGFETCRRMKANSLWAEIPVIFMTALDDTDNKVLGFQTGGVDYITKPIQYDETLARIKTHLALRSSHLRLQDQNARLLHEITERKKAEENIRMLNAELEQRVAERTAGLKTANEKLSWEVEERKRAETEANEKHNLLRTMIDILPDNVFFKDVNSRFILGNERVARLMGTTPENLIGRTDFDYFPESLARQYYHDEQAVIATGEPLMNKEEIVNDPDGNSQWYLTTKVPFRNELGEIKGIVGIGREISERKKLLTALQKAQEELESRVEQRTNELKRANEQLEALYRVGQTITAPLQLEVVLEVVARSTANLLGMDTGVILLVDETGEYLTIKGAYGLSEAVIKGTRDKIGESIAGRVVQTGQPIIYNDAPNDTRFSNLSATGEGLLSGVSVPLVLGERIIGTLDVHSKKSRQAFSEEHVRILNMLASQVVIAIENARMYNRLQSAHHELELRVRERTAELTEANTQLQKEIGERQRAEAALQEINENLEMKVETRTEELLAVNEELTAMNEELTVINEELQNANQELNQEIGKRQQVEIELADTNSELTRTIKELKTMQTYLIQSEKMVALGNLVAGMAHEINTPIGVGVTASSHLQQMTEQLIRLCRTGLPSVHELNEYLQDLQESSAIILKNMERAGKLIQSFKQVSVDQSSEIQRVFNVKRYLDEILLSVRPGLKKTKHRVIVECEDNLEIDGSAGAFSQIITNLLMNTLTHAYEQADKGEIIISAKKEGEHLLIVYSDDGKGMDYHVLTRIFDPFFTTKRGSGGTGLGLYLVYNIVTQQFGGTIDCTSEPGKGTTFRISLPLHR